jgi:hypothetical protein
MQTTLGVAPIVGDRIVWTIWGSVPEYNNDAKIFVNLPSGYYLSDQDAIADIAEFAVDTIPSDYIGTGFLIARVIFRVTDATPATYQLVYVDTIDLRGTYPQGVRQGAGTYNAYAPLIHNFIDTVRHPVTGLTTGHFLRATSPTTYAFGTATYTDVGAAAAGHLHTGVYEPVFTKYNLTKVDDTNVTLTLGGTPVGALLQPVSLTLGWTGTLADARITSAATWNAKEPGLGNPTVSGMILSSTTGGVRSWVFRDQHNASTAQQTGFSTDTYVAGSGITIPSGSLQAKSKYRLRFAVTKTAAGTAALVVTVRFGTNGSTADTARLTFTSPTVQTAAIDTVVFDLTVVFRTVGSGTSAVISGALSATKNTTNQNQGHWNGPTLSLQAVSAGFDSTVANSIIGVSYNGGTSYSGTCELVEAELINLN